MTIDRNTAVKLADLYRNREALQRQRERAMSRNLWIGFVERGQAPIQPAAERSTTECEQIVDSLGGRGEVAGLILQSVIERFEVMQRDLDQQITDLGGQP